VSPSIEDIQRHVGEAAAQTMDLLDRDEYLERVTAFMEASHDLRDLLVDAGFDPNDAVRMMVGNLLGMFYPSVGSE
jgi:hypothetical protein